MPPHMLAASDVVPKRQDSSRWAGAAVARIGVLDKTGAAWAEWAVEWAVEWAEWAVEWVEWAVAWVI